MSRLFDSQVIHHLLDTGDLPGKFLGKLLGVIGADVTSDQQHAFFEVALEDARTAQDA